MIQSTHAGEKECMIQSTYAGEKECMIQSTYAGEKECMILKNRKPSLLKAPAVVVFFELYS